jgi:hypothetical protein
MIDSATLGIMICNALLHSATGVGGKVRAFHAGEHQLKAQKDVATKVKQDRVVSVHHYQHL